MQRLYPTQHRLGEAYVSIIESLSAGYRFLTRRLDLILIPVLVDLFLWFLPRLSLAPLFEQAAQFYSDAAGQAEMPSDMTMMAQQVATVLRETGEKSNLFNLLLWISGSLLHLPSMLYVVDPPRAVEPQVLARISQAVVWGVLVTLVGVGVGVLYLLLLARSLPIGAASKSWTWGELPRLVSRYWVRMIVYLVGLVLLLIALFVPMTLAIAVLSLVSSGLTALLAFLFGGLTLVLFLYLYFVPAGLILDDLGLWPAVKQSFQLVRDNFWATLGLILLSDLISLGFSTILGRLVSFVPFGTLTAIVVNAFIGSGLALGFLIFYRSRVLLAQGEPVTMDL
jgi:hypothetical protein